MSLSPELARLIGLLDESTQTELRAYFQTLRGWYFAGLIASTGAVVLGLAGEFPEIFFKDLPEVWSRWRRGYVPDKPEGKITGKNSLALLVGSSYLLE